MSWMFAQETFYEEYCNVLTSTKASGELFKIYDEKKTGNRIL